MARGRAVPAMEHLGAAAVCLGRPAPSTRLDCLASLLWQLLVLLLDRLGLVSLLTRLGGKEAKEGESRWEAAETYHRLHQVRGPCHLSPSTCHLSRANCCLLFVTCHLWPGGAVHLRHQRH